MEGNGVVAKLIILINVYEFPLLLQVLNWTEINLLPFNNFFPIHLKSQELNMIET